MKRKVLTAAGICIGILILTEGSRYFVQNQKCQKQLFAMDTYMEFTAYGKNRPVNSNSNQTVTVHFNVWRFCEQSSQAYAAARNHANA